MLSPKPKILAKTYSGCYGGEINNVGDLVTVQIQCPHQSPSLAMKQILFLVDESGSMAETMPIIRASLFASRNSLLRLIGINITQTLDLGTDLRPDLDEIFSQECNASIITFSAAASCKWDSIAACKASSLSYSGESFTDAVNSLSSESSTNLGAALTLAFQKKVLNYATWIIILTDGKPNRGLYQTLESFQEIMHKVPPETKIIPLGYSTDFDPEILSILGTMIYLDSEESIPETLGSIMGEIVTCYGMNAHIHIPNILNSLREEVGSDDLIIVSDVIEPSRDLIGNKDIGCVYNDRKYLYGYLPWGNIKRSDRSKYEGLIGNVSYFDIIQRVNVSHDFIIELDDGPIPDDIYEGYFEASKGRIILDIFYRRKLGQLSAQYVNAIKTKIADWKHERAIIHKQEILRIVGANFNNRHERMSAIGLATSAQNQISYTNVGRYSTEAQRFGSISASQDFHTSYHPSRISLRTAGFIPIISHSTHSTSEVVIDRNLLDNI